MASISSKAAVAEILESRGTCEDFPIILVYRYKAINGQTNFALFTDSRFDDLKGQSTAYCQDVTCLMADGMLTDAGEKWLADNT